jgi:phage-related holin
VERSESEQYLYGAQQQENRMLVSVAVLDVCTNLVHSHIAIFWDVITGSAE